VPDEVDEELVRYRGSPLPELNETFREAVDESRRRGIRLGVDLATEVWEDAVLDFGAATRLGRDTVAQPVESGVAGVVDADGRAVGLFDDVLPTLRELRQRGLSRESTTTPSSTAPTPTTRRRGRRRRGRRPTWTRSWD
jgi:hypothetical protein